MYTNVNFGFIISFKQKNPILVWMKRSIKALCICMFSVFLRQENHFCRTTIANNKIHIHNTHIGDSIDDDDIIHVLVRMSVVFFATNVVAWKAKNQ